MLSDSVDEARLRTQECADDVRAKPLLAIGAALAVGFLIRRLIR